MNYIFWTLWSKSKHTTTNKQYKTSISYQYFGIVMIGLLILLVLI